MIIHDHDAIFIFEISSTRCDCISHNAYEIIYAVVMTLNMFDQVKYKWILLMKSTLRTYNMESLSLHLCLSSWLLLLFKAHDLHLYSTRVCIPTHKRRACTIQFFLLLLKFQHRNCHRLTLNFISRKFYFCVNYGLN